MWIPMRRDSGNERQLFFLDAESAVTYTATFNPDKEFVTIEIEKLEGLGRSHPLPFTGRDAIQFLQELRHSLVAARETRASLYLKKFMEEIESFLEEKGGRHE